MPVIYFLYSAMGCIVLFGFLHIFFDDRFMNLKTILLILLIIGFISFLIAMFIFLLYFLHMF